MSKAELIGEINRLKKSATHAEELQKTMQDLEIHQAELEMQNRELQEAQRLLECSRDRYALLHDYAPIGYVTLNASGVMQDLNFTAADMLGIERSRATGFPFYLHVQKQSVGEFWEHLRRCRRGDSRIATDLSIQPKGKEPLAVQIISVPGQGGEDDGIIFWTAIVDLTYRRGLEAERERFIREQARRAEAEDANRAKDEFLATLSHELRTPLNVISGWVQLLRMGDLQPSERARGYEVIQTSVRNQVQIINDLLDMSRIIRGILHLEKGPIDLSTILMEAVAGARFGALEKSVDMECKLLPHPCMVMGDAARLSQVFANLLQNAVKFTPAGGRVDVKLEPHRREDGAELVRVSVRDTGIGIKREFLPLVFERFRQEDTSTTRRHGGLGLGLAIVRHLVEIHGGNVRAESAGEGLGSTFRVDLPLMSSTSDERKQPVIALVAAQSLEGLAVLVVDDDAHTRDVLCRALAPLGAEMRAAGSAAEAYAAIEAMLPSVLVCDLGMPGEDGYSLIRRLRQLPREQGGELPALALTAFAGNRERDRAMTAGFDLFMSKPVETLELASQIAKLVNATDRAA